MVFSCNAFRAQTAFRSRPVSHFSRRGASKISAMAAGPEWTKQDTRRFLHAVYRVGDLDGTLEYYKKNFGMKQIRYRDIPEEKYTNAFLIAKGDEKTNFALELTYNYGKDGPEAYNIGDGFGHFALAVPDVYKLVDDVKKNGGNVSRDAGPVKGGTTEIAFVKDPTGYAWEIIQRKGKEIKEPIAQVMLRVTDLDKSIQYYTEALGMQLLKRKDNETGRYTLAFLSYGPEEENTVFELTYNWDRKEKYDLGDAYAQVALSTKDVYKTAESIKAAGGKVTREPGPLPGLNTKILATTDPDGWKVVFVDEADFLAEL